MAGRPAKFETAEELEDAKDGECNINIKAISNSEFTKEKDLKKYIIDNIESFVSIAFGDELVLFEEEFCFNKNMVRGKQGRGAKKIDIMVKGKKETYLIELKNPKYKSENRSAIGQLLDYGREYYISGGDKRSMILITTKFDLDTAKTIRYYDLPIRYFYITKNQIMEYLREE